MSSFVFESVVDEVIIEASSELVVLEVVRGSDCFLLVAVVSDDWDILNGFRLADSR